MKILQINAVYGIGSTGKIVQEQQDYINSNTSHICETAFCYGGDSSNGYVIGNKTNRDIHGFLSRLTGKQGWFSKKPTRELLKYIDEYKPDVVNLGNLHGNYINFPMLMEYLSEKDIPTVITLHDCWPFTGKCCHYTVDKCFKWQKGCGSCPRLKKDNKSWFFDRTAYLWHKKRELYNKIPRLAVVGVSDWITEEAKKSPLFENVKIFRRIYNGIDNSIFSFRETKLREKYGIEDKHVLVAVSSFWNESKGLSDIYRLSDLLGEEYRIVLIGKLAGEMPDNIIHIDATNNQNELADWYSAADVFITMSKEETFGKVSAEALMCGTPIVCFDSTANPELVGKNCGYVCRKGEVLEFKNSVEKIVNDGKEAYSEFCVNFAKKNFDLEKNIEQYLQLYEELQKVGSK